MDDKSSARMLFLHYNFCEEQFLLKLKQMEKCLLLNTTPKDFGKNLNWHKKVSCLGILKFWQKLTWHYVLLPLSFFISDTE